MQNEPTAFGEFMFRFICILLSVIPLTNLARGDVSPETARNLYEKVTPSLVAVQYTWEYEFGKVDFVAEGVVVSSDGLIVMHLSAISPQSSRDHALRKIAAIPRRFWQQ